MMKKKEKANSCSLGSFATHSETIKTYFINNLHYSQNDLKQLKNRIHDIKNLN